MTRSGNSAKMAVAPPSSQKSCLKYMKTRKRSMTTAPKGRNTLYMLAAVWSPSSPQQPSLALQQLRDKLCVCAWLRPHWS